MGDRVKVKLKSNIRVVSNEIQTIDKTVKVEDELIYNAQGEG